MLSPSEAALPADEVLHERLVEADAGGHRHEVDAAAAAGVLVALAEGADGLEVVVAHAGGIEGEAVGALDVLELDDALEGEVDLGLVEDVEEDDLVPAVAEMVQ